MYENERIGQFGTGRRDVRTKTLLIAALLAAALMAIGTPAKAQDAPPDCQAGAAPTGAPDGCDSGEVEVLPGGGGGGGGGNSGGHSNGGGGSSQSSSSGDVSSVKSQQVGDVTYESDGSGSDAANVPVAPAVFAAPDVAPSFTGDTANAATVVAPAPAYTPAPAVLPAAPVVAPAVFPAASTEAPAEAAPAAATAVAPAAAPAVAPAAAPAVEPEAAVQDAVQSPQPTALPDTGGVPIHALAGSVVGVLLACCWFVARLMVPRR